MVRSGNHRGWRLAVCAATLLAGCQAPAARFADDDPPCESRCVALAEQLVTDTAVEMTCHPVQSACAIVSEPVEFLQAAGHDVLGKRLALAFARHPEPLAPRRDHLDRAALQADMK